jgi:predicted GIY-YIG superfamily endonuclease
VLEPTRAAQHKALGGQTEAKFVNVKFANLLESLEPRFQRLIQMAPVKAEQLPRSMPGQGIYLFSQGNVHLYVGRSDNIRRRIGLHCRPSSQHNQATFAFRMAREETGQTQAAYTTLGSRLQMAKDAEFGPAFAACKARIRSLDLRFVEEADPTRQALLEIYTATVLETPFNDFANH